MENNVTNIRVIVKDGQKVLYDGYVGKSVDICYLGPQGGMLFMSPENFFRAVGKTRKMALTPLTKFEEVKELDIEVLTSMANKPMEPISSKIKCAGAVIFDDTAEAISFGFDVFSAIGIVHSVELQRSLGGTAQGLLPMFAQMLAPMVAAVMKNPNQFTAGAFDIGQLRKKG